MEILESTIREKINNKADQLGINRDLLYLAVECIVQCRLKDDAEAVDEIEGAILKDFIQQQGEAYELKNWEDFESKDPKKREKATILQRRLTGKEIDYLPVDPLVKELIRDLEKPQRIHVYALVMTVDEILKCRKKYEPWSVAELALQKAGLEIEMMYKSMGG
jgi:hypothetical protein